MYFYANFLCLFPAGNLLDRFSTKKLLMLAISVCTLGALFFSVATVYWAAALGRAMEGAGAAFCFLSCIRIASRWFSPNQMAFVTGVIVTMAMLGGLVAQTPFALLVASLQNWRHALYINAILGVIILFVVFFVVQDRPPDAKTEAQVDHQQLQKLGLWQCIRLAAFNGQNWLGGLYTALVNLPVFILGGLWGILYLTRVHHVSSTQASYATTLFFVGVILGSLGYGWISDRLERRVMPMIVGAVLSIIVIFILMYAKGLALWQIIMLFFLIGFTTSSQVLTYPLIAELNPIYLTITAVSIDSLCIMASGFIVPPFFGWLMQRSGTQAMVDGVTAYTPADFNHAMLLIPIAFIVARIITAFMRETYCKSQD
jgi:MFS family permease